MFLQQIIGAAISEVILQFLNENNTLTRKMHGQGYDGASNMSSNVAGVQASIKKSGSFIYLHTMQWSLLQSYSKQKL